MNRLTRFSILFGVLAGLGACSYKGGDIGDPIHRKFHWSSFVSGEDMAAICAAETPDRVRLVYNAVWGEQVRIYEWDSVRRVLRIRVIGSGDLRGMSLGDPLGNWRAVEQSVSLDPSAYDELMAALGESGGFGPPAVGLELVSRSYYWAAATCRQGSFTFTGWKYPSPEFESARFAAKLFALDPDRADIRPPAPIPFDVMYEYNRNQAKVMEFTFKVGPAGLGK
ncbi:hypothetical protein CU669_17215 [Paramagnetospirillum kuznetsovii]|uniref:Lipoprotein n=1 Tax=Paramagnetospirillum kuznetsovii TaxID=2053833 RepID=A0A364NUJ4_9PROT|nr:hypothetical protein [Paramagnetospirillum kuznetsovii]RAU20680.1 hypothetical protein CU669_17215 [Paramagnetospirillum kuznetsovii]